MLKENQIILDRMFWNEIKIEEYFYRIIIINNRLNSIP